MNHKCISLSKLSSGYQFFFCRLMRIHPVYYASINSKLQHPFTRVFKLMRINSFKFPPASPGPKLHSNTPPNIERFFVWSTNVVEVNEVTFHFFVLLLDFSLVSIILWCENCLSHETRFLAVNLLHYSTCITLERLYTTSSNAPSHHGKVQILLPPGTYGVQMPVGCPRGCWSFDVTLMSTLDDQS